VVVALVALPCYLVSADRGFSYDESLTFGAFVSQGWLTPFAEQVVHNNHPLFSFLEHVVFATGGTSEQSQRLLPAGFAAVNVGLVGWWCARRWGLLSGLLGAMTLFVLPLTVSMAREVRGYSLLVLAATASTMLLISMLEGNDRPLAKIGYVLTIAVGVATHLYMAPVLLSHLGLLVARRAMTLQRLQLMLLGGVIGLLAHLQIPPDLSQRRFVPDFPIESAQTVLGDNPFAVVVLGGCAAAALLAHRRDLLMIVLPVASVATVWLIAQPLHLYPRFLAWTVPGVAGATAWAVARQRWMIAPVLLVIVSLLPNLAPEPEPGIREVARVVERAHAAGLYVCAIGGESLVGYTPPVPELTSLDQGCEVVAVLGSWTLPPKVELESRWGPPVAIEGSAVLAPPETRAALGIS
jgi:uncharacterized membrane protein